MAANSRFAKTAEVDIRNIQSEGLQTIGNDLSLFAFGNSSFPFGNICEKPPDPELN